MNGEIRAVSSGYVESHLVGTGECGVMGRIERLFRGTFGGHSRMWRYGLYRVAI